MHHAHLHNGEPMDAHEINTRILFAAEYLANRIIHKDEPQSSSQFWAEEILELVKMKG